MSDKQLNGREIAAIILAALLILTPLTMAPTISDVTYQEGSAANPSSGNQPWHGILSGTHVTDWLTLLILAFQLLIFGRQAGISDRQTDLLAKQATIDQQNYLQTHRPKLRVRNVVIRNFIFKKGMPLRGQFYVDNVGGTNAKVTESHCEFLWNVNGLPMERPYEGKTGNNPIPVGTIIAGTVAVTAQFDSYPLAYPDIDPPGIDSANRAFFMGWIDYLDDTGLKRRTAFCREFLQRDGGARFYAVYDPDYEYEA